MAIFGGFQVVCAIQFGRVHNVLGADLGLTDWVHLWLAAFVRRLGTRRTGAVALRSQLFSDNTAIEESHVAAISKDFCFHITFRSWLMSANIGPHAFLFIRYFVGLCSRFKNCKIILHPRLLDQLLSLATPLGAWNSALQRHFSKC